MLMDKNDAKSKEERLKAALMSEKTVSILLVGPSGSGKTHTAEAVLEQLGFKRRYISAQFAPQTPDGWFALMGDMMRAQNRVLVIDHIEDMPMLAQAAMFTAFSNTHDELSTFPDSSYSVKVIFTSVKSIAELRSSADVLMPHVYDRISHIIVRFKGLAEAQNLWDSFKSVWKAQKLQESGQLPDATLRAWIHNNVEKMNGNFRDLEKIAIRWHHYRALGYEEGRILGHIRKEYEEVGFGAEPEETGAVFHIPSDKPWVEIEAEFRRYVKEWAVKETGSVKQAAAKLKVSARTLDRWT